MSDNRPACPECGVLFDDHPGMVLLCRQVQAACRNGLDGALNDAVDILPDEYRLCIEFRNDCASIQLFWDGEEKFIGDGPADGEESSAECIRRLSEEAVKHFAGVEARRNADLAEHYFGTDRKPE